jgi:hypothetical protein
MSQEKQDAPSDDELARRLQNPLANLICVPFQNNFGFGLDPIDGGR